MLVGSAPRPGGRLRGSSCTGACAHLWVCWEVCMVCVVISYHYLTSTTLKRRWEWAWGSATLNLVQPRKKPRCEAKSTLECSACWLPPELARGSFGVSRRASSRRGRAEAGALHQQEGQDCATSCCCSTVQVIF